MKNLTEQLIMEEYMKLLWQNPYKTITVKRIIQACGISRNTFYYHFRSAGEVPERYYSSRINGIIREYAGKEDVSDILIRIERFLQSEETPILHILRGVPREYLHLSFKRICSRSVELHVDLTTKEMKLDPEGKAILIRFYTAVVEGVMLDWIDADMNYDIVAMTQKLCSLLQGSVNNAFVRIEDPMLR